MKSVEIILNRMLQAIANALVGSYKSHYIKRVGTAYRQLDKEQRALANYKVAIPTTGADKVNLKNDGKNVVKDFNRAKNTLVEELDLCL